MSEIPKTSMSKKVCVMYGVWTEYSLLTNFEVTIMNTNKFLLLLLLFLLLKHHNLLWTLASNTVFLHSSVTIVYLYFLFPLCLNPLQTCRSISYVVFFFSMFLQTSFTYLETVLLFNSFIFQYVKFMSKRSWYQSKNWIFTANKCWCTETCAMIIYSVLSD